MMNNNHNHSGCGFSETLVSYLYGETHEAEKAVFEKHLAACPVCTGELELFSGVHFSIADWKAQEFALMETPVIEIPYEKAGQRAEVPVIKGSWLSGLRDLFARSPRWSLAAASLVVLAVCAGIALFALKSPSSDDVAVTNKTQPKPVISPIAEKTPPSTANANGSENTPPVRQPKPSTADVAAANENKPANNRAVKVANNPRPLPVKDTNRKINDDKEADKNKKLAPKVVEDDDEDDTLRLAELFDEIDTK
jgi:hypothetical protein